MSAGPATALAAVLVGTATLCWPVRGHRGCARPAGARPAGATTDDRDAAGSGVADVVLIDLVVAALAAGLPASAAVSAAHSAVAPSTTAPAATVTQHRVPLAVGWAFGLAERTGASAAELLRRAAADERSARRAAVSVAASRLGVRLVVPLGLTILPAFVLLGVAPVVIGLAQQLLAV